MSPNVALSKTSLAAAIDQAADCIVITDTSGTIQYVNPAYSAMTGYTLEEAVGQNARLHKSGCHSLEFYHQLWKTISAGQKWQGEMTNRRKDGTRYQEEMQINPVRDSQGRIVQYIAIKKDVTERRREELAILNSLHFAQSTIDALSSHICVLDEDGKIIAVNRAWREFASANCGSAECSSGQDFSEGVNYLDVCWRALGEEAQEAAEFAAGLRSVLHGERDKFAAEYACHSPTERRWFLGRVTRFAGDHPTRILIEHINITERRLAEESLLFKTALLEGQTETMIDGILVVDEENRIALANNQFGLIFGIPPELLSLGNDLPVRKYVTDQVEDPEAFQVKVNELYLNREAKSRDELNLKNGKTLDRYSAPLVDSRGCHRGRIWYFRDITDRKVAEARSHFLAFHDALTGLPHRALLQDRLNTAVARARRKGEKIALLFLDLDRFKNINDMFGHAYGDDVLKDVAQRLRTWAREQDTVARLGGDEFVIMLNGVDGVANAAAAAQRVLQLMNESFLIQGQSLSVSCSIGVSLFPDHGSDGETLLKNADAALYSAKEDGRGNVRFFTGAMNAKATEWLRIEKNLRVALDRDEFFLVYQPQMEISSGNITGVEALLRWQQPEMGLVPPASFVPIAESSGLILPIGEWALRTACAQVRRWHDEDALTVPVAVNVSAVQVRQEGFADVIRRVLLETRLPPQFLELELTESVLLSNADVIFSVLQELKGMGVKLAIDDFGIGYSSFSYLRQFRANRLKIDQSFIQHVAADPDDAAITIAVINMAKSLRMKVVAEGVETAAQMAFLRKNGCDQMQGYYFSRPIMAEDLPARLATLRGDAVDTFSAEDAEDMAAASLQGEAAQAQLTEQPRSSSTTPAISLW
jgi:diguanylate cyclase (GGDEF)-like protein/PAS domain S-box-containing protein